MHRNNTKDGSMGLIWSVSVVPSSIPKEGEKVVTDIRRSENPDAEFLSYTVGSMSALIKKIAEACNGDVSKVPEGVAYDVASVMALLVYSWSATQSPSDDDDTEGNAP